MYQSLITKYLQINAKRKFLYSKNRNKILILATQTKTGTHFIRYFICTYLYLLKNQKSEINLDLSIMGDYLPNSWGSYLHKKPYREPSKLLQNFELDDIPRVHSSYNSLWNKNYVLHTYRNPFDFAVFYFFYKYVILNNYKYSSPYELLIDKIDEFVLGYKSFYSFKNNKTNILSFSFEEIYKNKNIVFEIIFDWLGISIDIAIFKKSLEIVSKHKPTYWGAGEKWFWDKTKLNSNDKKLIEFENTINENGPIGIWRKYFDDNQFKEITKVLYKNHLSINEFILD